MSDCWFPFASFDVVHAGYFTAASFQCQHYLVTVRIKMWLKENKFYRVLPSLHPSSLVELCKVKMMFAFWFHFKTLTTDWLTVFHTCLQISLLQ